MPSAVLRTARLASLFLAFAFGVIGMGVGINALVQFNKEKKDILHAVPAGATVDVDAHDVQNSGYVLTVVCGLIALASFLFLLPVFVFPALVGRTLRIQGAVLAFLSVWLFATIIPFTDFFANRSAQISASIGSLVLPPAEIQAIAASLGVTPVYNKVDYLRLSAVLPWFAFLFGATSSILSFLDTHETRHITTAYPVSSDGVDREEVAEKQVISEKEKATIAQQEV